MEEMSSRAQSRDERSQAKVAAAVEKKNAEMLRQEQLADRSPTAAKTGKELEGEDKAVADTFPASDPPSPP